MAQEKLSFLCLSSQALDKTCQCLGLVNEMGSGVNKQCLRVMMMCERGIPCSQNHDHEARAYCHSCCAEMLDLLSCYCFHTLTTDNFGTQKQSQEFPALRVMQSKVVVADAFLQKPQTLLEQEIAVDHWTFLA